MIASNWLLLGGVEGWMFLLFLFGVPIALVYAVATRKKKRETQDERHSRLLHERYRDATKDDD